MIWRSTGRPSASTQPPAAAPERDRGAVLPLVLVMMVIGSMIVLPVMTYATTVLRANSVLSAKTQRFEAVKAGLRTALFDPLDLYRKCDQSQAEAVDYSSVDVNGVQVDSTCQLVGYAKTTIDDHLRYGLAATEFGASVPVELKGKKYSSATDASEWATLTTSALEDDPLESRAGTIWLPDLASYPLITRTRVQGYDMPPSYGGCKVYFPGKYVDDLVLSGPTFFTSGIYYFEGEVRVEGGANVVVGDGRYPGCASSQEAVFFSDPTLSSTEPHSITGFGATWLFGDAGRLVVSNDNGRKLDFLFNRRYVDERTSDPSLFVSIASVNGDLAADGTYIDYTDPGYVNVPRSRVLVGQAQNGTEILESPIDNQMRPSVLTDVARLPGAPIVAAPVSYRTADIEVLGNNGGAYLTWQAPPQETWGNLPLDRYEVFVDDEPDPECVVPANALVLECPVPDLSVDLVDTTHAFHVVAVNAFGSSERATVSATYRNGVLGVGATPGLHATVPAPLNPNVTAGNGVARVNWDALTPLPSPSTPITEYTVTATRTSDSSETRQCTTLNRAATSCYLTDLGNRRWDITITATNLVGMTSDTITAGTDVRANGDGSAPNPDPDNLAPDAPGPITAPTAQHTEPIVDVDLSHTDDSAPASIRIPGYIAVPQGTVAINNPGGDHMQVGGHHMQVVGGILAARFDVNDGRVSGDECTVAPAHPTGWVAGQNCVSLGFESEVVQMRLRIESTTSAGGEKSVAVVQVNENGAYAVNSWEVQ